jgi:hypothetical protein
MQHMHAVAARQDSSSVSSLRAWLRRATWIGGVAAGLALSACLGPAGDEVADSALNDASAGSEHEISQALGSFPVGVIPGVNQDCPPNSDELIIRMDDEDTGNKSHQWLWVGRTNQNETNSHNTRFYFCRVEGGLFRPFSTDLNDVQDDYAVLKLGPSCPPGSVEFNRFFDNEDSHNANFFSGDIAPNESTGNTRLFFCMFRAAQPNDPTISSFPDLGFSYGVFAPADFDHGALDKGEIRSDDEDTDNDNSYTVPAQASTAARRIVDDIVGGTVLHTALVR